MIALVVIGIIFYNYAKSCSINNTVWVLIGLASYFIPQVIVGVVIALVAPQMLKEEVGLNILGMAVGIIGSIITYQIMIKYATNNAIKKEVDETLLDSDLED